MNARYLALAIWGILMGCASTPIEDTAPVPAEVPEHVARYPACDPAPWGQDDAPRQGGEASAEVTVWPIIENQMEVRFAMEHAFIQAVMDSMSTGGPKPMTVRVVYDLYIDPMGEVTDIQVAKSTGDEALDSGGLEAARRARFTQALQGDCGVGVWMQLPMMLRVGVGGGGGSAP